MFGFIDNYDLIFQNKRNKLKIINFNYDRIIDWFIYLHFKRTLVNSDRQLWQLYHYLKECFIHVYGSVGKIKEIEDMNDSITIDKEKYLPFGNSNDNLISLLDFRNQFKPMFHERSMLTETERKCEQFLNDAEKLLLWVMVSMILIITELG
ncbi:MAG: hypothetical protein IPK10_16225 [Bacteroidetes bacterium]|nr:hypothetical protein [Bacteroidota bacterium]